MDCSGKDFFACAAFSLYEDIGVAGGELLGLSLYFSDLAAASDYIVKGKIEPVVLQLFYRCFQLHGFGFFLELHRKQFRHLVDKFKKGFLSLKQSVYVFLVGIDAYGAVNFSFVYYGHRYHRVDIAVIFFRTILAACKVSLAVIDYENFSFFDSLHKHGIFSQLVQFTVVGDAVLAVSNNQKVHIAYQHLHLSYRVDNTCRLLYVFFYAA